MNKGPKAHIKMKKLATDITNLLSILCLTLGVALAQTTTVKGVITDTKTGALPMPKAATALPYQPINQSLSLPTLGT